MALVDGIIRPGFRPDPPLTDTLANLFGGDTNHTLKEAVAIIEKGGKQETGITPDGSVVVVDRYTAPLQDGGVLIFDRTRRSAAPTPADPLVSIMTYRQSPGGDVSHQAELGRTAADVSSVIRGTITTFQENLAAAKAALPPSPRRSRLAARLRRLVSFHRAA